MAAQKEARKSSAIRKWKLVFRERDETDIVLIKRLIPDVRLAMLEYFMAKFGVLQKAQDQLTTPGCKWQFNPGFVQLCIGKNCF